MPTTSLGLGDAFKSLVQADALGPRYAADREYRESMAAKALVEAERERMALQAMQDPEVRAYLQQIGVPGAAAGLVTNFNDLGGGYGKLADEDIRRRMLAGQLDMSRVGGAQAAMRGVAPVQESGGMFYNPYVMGSGAPTAVGAANINQSNASAGASGASAVNSLAAAKANQVLAQQRQQDIMHRTQMNPLEVWKAEVDAGAATNDLQRKAQLHEYQLQEARGKGATAGTPMSAQEFLFWRGLPPDQQPTYKDFAVRPMDTWGMPQQPAAGAPNDPMNVRGYIK